MDTLYFIHTPRTGGTSLKVLLSKYNNDKFHFSMNGHQPYCDNFKLQLEKNGPVKSLVCLRCPIEHTISLYSYIKMDYNHPHHDYVKKFGFSKWIREKHIHNYYSTFFSRTSNPKLMVDPLNTLNKINYIINTKTLTNSIKPLLNLYGINESELTCVNYSLNKPNITLEDKEYIQEIRQKDFKLLNSIGFKF